jgi:excisionase family DNA binding protein
MPGPKRFQTVIPKQIRFDREQAAKCRELARLTDEIRRRLTDIAEEWEGRARETENLSDVPRTETRPAPALQPSQAIEPLTLSIKDTAQLLGIGRSTIYRLIGDRQLQTVKIGNRTLIKTASIRGLIEIQP